MPRVPTILLFVAGFSLGLALALASPTVALAAVVPAAALAVVACELLARSERGPEIPQEPWRLDAWTVLVGTLAVLGLAASIGPEATGAAWLLVALIGGLGFASLPNLAPRPRA